MDSGNAASSPLLMGFVGDVVIDRDDPHEVFAEVRELLRASDILFGNLESPYSNAPENAVTAHLVIAPQLHNLEAYPKAGFSVLSMANNHIVDAGHGAMLETQRRLRSQGVATIGVGQNLTEARRPTIVERRGCKVGFLGYASIFPHGYQARSNVPGLAPLRAYNHFYDQAENYVPGYLPRVETIPDPEDHRSLGEDIQALRQSADLVVTSFHWGDHLRPYVLTDHEKRTARFCIDRGADLVLGHHHHALRGIEWYRDKPIFYGLGNFVFDHRLVATDELQAYFDQVDPASYAVCPREGWPLLPLHPDTRMTLLGWTRIERGRVTDVGFVPCRLRPSGQVYPVRPESLEGREIIEYMNRCNRSEKLNGKLVTEAAPLVGGHPSVRVVAVA